MNTRLFRSRDDRMIAGVAGGLAELWDADPSLVRLGWALLAIFTGGIAIIVYLVLAIVVPEEDDVEWTASGTAADPASAVAAELAHADRAAARQARRQRRAMRRANRDHGPRTGAIVIGMLLILGGASFLAREYLPWLDWDWVWPTSLVAVGILVLVLAVRRPGGDVPPTTTPGATS
jgi:phage shock protein PspC (stress-responsive transcriptional regulator)